MDILMPFYQEKFPGVVGLIMSKTGTSTETIQIYYF